jgi:hypothetical protein
MLFLRLDAALRLPDSATTSDEGCPAIPQAPKTIYVKTTEGRWRVHVPVDGCGRYVARVEKALGKLLWPA